MDYLENEIPKHKRKKQKTPKKSNHKHAYKLVKVEIAFTFGRANTEQANHMVKKIEECIQCSKIKKETVILNQSEYENLKNRINLDE